MAVLAEWPYSKPILGNVRMSDPEDIAEVLIRPWPETARQLQAKHAVQAIYEAGSAVAVIPMTTQQYVPKLYAGLFLESRQIGFMKWHPKPTSMAGDANNTFNAMNATTSTTVLDLVRGDESTGLRDNTGTLVDKHDSKFMVTYKLSDRPAYYRETFTAVLDAMVIAAPNEATHTGAFVNYVSVSGDVTLNVHGTRTPSLLSWKLMVRTFVLLWEDGDCGNEVDFEMLYDGIKIGEGFILNLTASRTNMVSSR